MKDVNWESDLPDCDWCRSKGCAAYNAPTHVGPWADLCGPCFKLIGIDTSVTEHRVKRDPWPKQVAAIALRWAGRGATIREIRSGVWRVVEMDGDTPGYVYEVYTPGTPFGVREDDGRPCYEKVIMDDAWAVVCLNDAPDGWFTVSLDGEYVGPRGDRVDVW